MTIGLRARAAIAVAVLVLALTVLVSIVVTRSDAALASLERARFEARTQQLADTVAYAVLAESEALLADPLASFARAPDVIDVEVRAAGDRSIARAAGAGLLSSTSSASSASSASPASSAWSAWSANAVERTSVTAPVRTKAALPGDDDGELSAFGVGASAPRLVGEVRVSFSTAAIADVQTRTRRDMVTAAAALGLLGVLVTALMMTSVVRRVRKVADAAARVRAGTWATTVDVGGGDELTRLGDDFNAMTAALQAQQRELDDAARALADRESLAAIGRATAVIAHELKNPLGIVLGAAQIVGNEKKPEAARMQAARIVEEEVRRLSRTLEDLLSYAKPRAPRSGVVDVRAQCDVAIVRAQSAGGPLEHNVACVVRGDSVRARADDAHLQQILLNLVQNAAQAGARHVTLTIEPVSTTVRIIVQDDGPGVPLDVRDQLFLPFATTKQRGTGLGLAASRRLARDNGGDLTFEHQGQDQGARFVLTLIACVVEESP